MKTAGLVLDFYDDSKGELLKQAFPTIEDLPEIIKEAHILIPEEREVLRDEAYALILHNEGKQFRKFACVDAGNTFLSALYFVENKDKLPEEAQKVASANILAAAEEFGLTEIIDPLVKVAAELDKEASLPSYLKNKTKKIWGISHITDWPKDKKLVHKLEQWQSGKQDSPHFKGLSQADKEARREGIKNAPADSALGQWKKSRKELKKESAAIADAPQATGMTYKWNGVEYVEPEALANKPPTPHKISKKAAKLGQKKTATGMARTRDSFQQPHVGDEADWSQRTNLLSVRGGADSGKVIPTANQMKTASIVDVSNLEAPVILKNKTASITALHGKYALDSYIDVQNAVEFFDQNWTGMSPVARHEYAVKTAARADELGIQISTVMDRYGSTEYAPDLDAHLANRVQQTTTENAKIYRDLQEKTASVSPDEFVQLLAEADEQTGLCYEYGNAVCDPYLATYGGRGIEKKAGWSWEDGQLSLNEQGLKSISADQLAKTFNPDVASAFSKDPIQIFDSMPREQKILIAKMVN